MTASSASCGCSPKIGRRDGSTPPDLAPRRASSHVGVADMLKGWGARWGFRRMDRQVEPGLYSLNDARSDSPVLVTSNYQLTFDAVRQELEGIGAWLLVLDTGGVNVWCAAGKGTFSTKELLERIESSRLTEFVNHRTLILPQLGATGVRARDVASTGWRVVWGPVLARDLPEFLRSGSKKTPAMRTIAFDLRDRMVLAPMELVHVVKWLPLFVAFAAMLAFPPGEEFAGRFLGNGMLLLGSLLLGSVVFPLLLPWLPFEAFGLKGLALGLAGNAILGILAHLWIGTPWHALVAAGLPATALVVWLAMNFTGCTTFTSQTGAALEVKVAVKPLLAATLAGIATALWRMAAG